MPSGREFISISVTIYSPSSDWLALGLTSVLGLSNGVFGSLPIILAPQKVAKRKEGTELTGNLMTGKAQPNCKLRISPF